MSILDRTDIVRRFEGNSWLKWLGGFALAMVVSFSAVDAASAQTRSLKLYFIHTKERAEIVYKRNGRYDQRGLDQINRFLRDWRRNEPAKMDPRLLDLLWEVYRSVGARDYIHVVSAYRSPATNKMLRSRSSGVAEKSQHTMGKAIDFYIPGVPLSKLRAAGFKAEGGGVGYYPKSGSPFVHLDVGNVRSWPRMGRSELMALFPDGRTIHVPADGKPLPGYKQALAAYEARRRGGASVQIASATPSDAGSSGSARSNRGGFLANLFGGGADEEEDSSPALTATAPARAPAAAATARPAAPVQAEPQRETPESIIASLPARSVPLPASAPRPVVDVGAPSAPLIAGLPAQAPAASVPAEPVRAEATPAEAVEVAVNVPVPTRRPDYSVPAEDAVQLAAAEPAVADLPVSAIVPEPRSGGGSDAISEMLAASGATQGTVGGVLSAPVPELRPRLNTPDDAAGTQVASASPSLPEDGGILALASVSGGRLSATDLMTGALPAAAVSRSATTGGLAKGTRLASASPRSAVIDSASVPAVINELESDARRTARAARLPVGETRPAPKSVMIPAQPDMARWAFKRDVTVSTAGGTTEPAEAHNIVRSAPDVIYTAGFLRNQQQAQPHRFTGKAVTFMSIARFGTN